MKNTQTRLLILLVVVISLFGCKTKNVFISSNANLENKNTEIVKIAVEDIKLGEKYWGLKCSEYKYTNKQEFIYKLDGKIELTGTLTKADNLIFTPNKAKGKNGILIVNNNEKPFFMWIKFENEDELYKQLSIEQQTICSKHESVEITLQIKDYTVAAAYNDLFVQAVFVKIIE